MVKSYRLLRAIMNTAVKEDEILRANPCRIKGYDSHHTAERPIATVVQVCPGGRRAGAVRRADRRGSVLRAALG
ncbi:MAG: hypothetical protein JXA67_08435 [Micromonosporaceae bacterium]|nr:hypothetical protein [Micromonosporaceae bacterium]